MTSHTQKAHNKNNTNSAKKKVNFQSDLSSLDSFSDGSNVSLYPRPQSVAQRILKERQERNITAKVPVTPDSTDRQTDKKSKDRQRQPLHLALRASDQKKKFSSKSEMSEKIKEEAGAG